jgi:hypothetical protein
MKTILLLMCTLFLISQVSFGKEMNTKTSASNNEIKLERIVFKNASVSKKALIEKHRIWLNFSNAEGAFKQLLVGYATGATNGWDKLFDSVTIDSNPYVDFYSINLGKRLTIQGRALPFLTTDEVPLGYKTTIVGTFNITIDHVDGLFVNQDIFLKDLVTGVIHNLKNGTYSFTTVAGRFDDRFVLLYINSIPTPPAPPAEPIVTDPVVTVPVVPTPVVTDPVVTVPVVPTPVVTDPVVTVPVVPTPVVTDPVVTVPVVPTPVVTDPVVTVPVVPTPVVTDPVVTVPVVPTPVVTEPVVTVPVVPTPVVTEPVVTVPVVPTPVVTEPVVTVSVVPAPVVPAPVVTVPVVPTPVVTEPVVTVPVVPIPVVTEPVVTVPVVPTPVVTEPVVTVPVVPTPVVTDPVVTVPVVPDPFAVNIEGKVYGAKGKSIVVSVNDSQVTINSVGTDINEVLVYSTGQIQLFERKNINANEFVIDGIAATKQVLIIKTHLRNGKWATSKVIL